MNNEEYISEEKIYRSLEGSEIIIIHSNLGRRYKKIGEKLYLMPERESAKLEDELTAIIRISKENKEIARKREIEKIKQETKQEIQELQKELEQLKQLYEEKQRDIEIQELQKELEQLKQLYEEKQRDKEIQELQKELEQLKQLYEEKQIEKEKHRQEEEERKLAIELEKEKHRQEEEKRKLAIELEIGKHRQEEEERKLAIEIEKSKEKLQTDETEEQTGITDLEVDMINTENNLEDNYSETSKTYTELIEKTGKLEINAGDIKDIKEEPTFKQSLNYQRYTYEKLDKDSSMQKRRRFTYAFVNIGYSIFITLLNIVYSIYMLWEEAKLIDTLGTRIKLLQRWFIEICEKHKKDIKMGKVLVKNLAYCQNKTALQFGYIEKYRNTRRNYKEPYKTKYKNKQPRKRYYVKNYKYKRPRKRYYVKNYKYKRPYKAKKRLTEYKCYNYKNLGHITRNCKIPRDPKKKQLSEIVIEENKYTQIEYIDYELEKEDSIYELTDNKSNTIQIINTNILLFKIRK